MSTFKKVLVSVLVASFAFVAVSSSASAQTYSWSGSLKQGSKGTQVWNLQKFLNLCADTQVAVYGAGSPGMESQSFGPATKAAVIKFQMKNQVMPASGIFGPLSQAKAAMLLASGNVCGGVATSGLPAGCTTTAGFSSITGASCAGASSLPAGCLPGYMFSSTTGAACTPGSTPSNNGGTLSGTTGAINTVTTLSGYSNQKVGEGDTNTKVFGVEVKADNGSDLRLTTMKVEFNQSNGGGSRKLNRYAQTITVWDDNGNKVGSADASDFSEDSNVYTGTIALSNAIAKAGVKTRFYVAVTADANIDSTDLANNTWTVTLDSIRYNDASGVVLTETTTNNGTFQFQSLANANDLEFKVNLSTDNPTAQTIKVSTTSNTNQVPVLKFTLKAQGGKMHIDQIPVLLTATGSAAADLDAATSNLTLKINGQSFNESVVTANTSTASVLFNNLNFDIAADNTLTGTVYADINDMDTTTFAAGDTLVASVPSSYVTATSGTYFDVEDQNGDQLVSGDRTGSAIGSVMTFRSTGVNVVMGSPSISYTAGGQGVYDSATYSIPVSVTSFGNTLYVGQSAQLASTVSASNAFAVAFQKASAPSVDVTSGVTDTITLSSSDAVVETNGYRLDDGTTKHFTLTVNIFGGNTAGAYRVALKQIQTFTNGTLNTGAALQSLLPVEQFQTNYQNITK